MSPSPKVLVTSGSSGGHLFPAEALIDALKEDGIETLLVLPKKNILKNKEGAAYNAECISVSSVGLKPSLKNIFAAFNFLKSLCEACRILRRFKPDAVAGFGSISSVPVVLLGRISGIKILIHEQNVYPGRATRLLSGAADSIAVSFPGTADYLKKYRAKIILTGNPLRKGMEPVSREEALAFFGLSRDKITVLVCGGSQASSRLNTVFPEALSGAEGKPGIQVIHLSGEKELRQVEDMYAGIGVDARCFSFLDEMRYAYSAADLAVSRAGAATISELVYFRVPAILVPYPYAYRHQSLNAEVLKKAGAASVIDDAQFGKERLCGELNRVIFSGELSRMRASYGPLPKGDHGAALKEALLSLIKRQEKN